MTDLAPGAEGANGQGTEAGAGTPAPGPTIPWLEGADETLVGYVQNKGWSEPKQVLEGYRNLEKLLGADRAGNAVILPKPDASPQEMDAFFNRLGRPADAAGYKIEMPEGADPAFAKQAGEWFHKHGVSQKAGEGISAEWNTHIKTLMETQKAQAEQAYAADDAALKSEWGAAFQQNLTQAQTAARGLGVAPEMIDQLSQTLGHKATMAFFQKIGAQMGEAEFVTGDKAPKFGSAMTPGQAKARIQELTRDKNFVSRYVSHDTEAVAEMKRLHAFAHPEE